MKVVAEKDAGSPGRVASNRRRVLQHSFPISRQGDHAVERGDGLRHPQEMCLADENHAVGKQMRSRRQQVGVRNRSFTVLERGFQRLMIHRDAGATAIEQFRGSAAVSRQEIGQRPQALIVHAYQGAASGAKKATASASSRVRFIGGRLRQMRLP